MTFTVRLNKSNYCEDLFVPEGEGGGGEETRSGTEKRCSHNLQSGHPTWWSADNCTYPFSEAKSEAKSEPVEEIKNA